MAANVHITAARRNAMIDNLAGQFNSGLLRIYDGTQATNADTAVGAQVLLAELTFNATAFGAASAGVATANAITSDTSANATGTASWFRCTASNGTTVLLDGSVGTSGSDLNLNSVAIQSAATVAVTAFTLTMAA
jgi:hypothetical protein